MQHVAAARRVLGEWQFMLSVIRRLPVPHVSVPATGGWLALDNA
jgi:hypothetical protein